MTFTVLTAEFAHESNTFSIRPTDLAAFRARLFLQGDAAVAQRADANTDIAGFMDVARAQSWQTRHAISAAASPAGPVTRAAFDEIAGCILAAAKAGPLDGILLGLHGAMVVEDHPDGEGLLLERLRAVVGPDMPIGITLDPHANVTARMCTLAQVMMSYSTYPHVDMRDTARRAANLLHRTMTGEIAPRTLRVTRPMLEEANSGRTDEGPMIARHALARAHEGTPGALAVSINAGFGNADIPELGPTVLVTHTGDAGPHLAFAEALADDIWARRHDVLNRFLTPAEAAAEALAHSSPGPLVIADYSDNPGAGSYGDAPGLLSALLDAGVTGACFGPMVDPEAAALLHAQTVGAEVTLPLGGKTDPRFGGGPIRVTGTVVLLSDGRYTGDGPMIGGLPGDWGPTAVLRVGGVDVLVVTNPGQMLDLQQFRAFGIDPAAQRIVALKSQQHFRAAFTPIAAKVIVCDSGALCSPDLRRLPFHRVPRPMYPLD
ncbi:M81 family metallopeptidase [Tabrizicola sp.]|uniref:M81 family metallopeptidase n=1 Tax=Tabrizicola sp. TaxID=2005166 RepID=UPI00260684FE|nr:M81 family metallopeptidase [Tabrizicola sp.]MDM7933015.1 M81 family metallopeptidase [Tabrizicola sp.]